MNKQGRRLIGFTLLLAVGMGIYQMSKFHPNEFTDSLIQSFEEDPGWTFKEDTNIYFAYHLEKDMTINIFWDDTQIPTKYKGSLHREGSTEDLTRDEAIVLSYYLHDRQGIHRKVVKEVSLNNNGKVLTLSEKAPPIVKQQVNHWVKKLVKDGHLEEAGD